MLFITTITRSIVAAIFLGGLVFPCGGKTLTDTTFEHDTQASTGQTTGTWAIRFCRESCASSHEGWESLQEGMLEENIFLATVDVGKEVGLAKRFHDYIHDKDPVVVLLRRGKMYVRGLDFGEIEEWMVSGWEKEEPLEVPEEPGFLVERQQMVVVGGVLVVLVGILWMMMIRHSESTNVSEKKD